MRHWLLAAIASSALLVIPSCEEKSRDPLPQHPTHVVTDAESGVHTVILEEQMHVNAGGRTQIDMVEVGVRMEADVLDGELRGGVRLAIRLHSSKGSKFALGAVDVLTSLGLLSGECAESRYGKSLQVDLSLEELRSARITFVQFESGASLYLEFPNERGKARGAFLRAVEEELGRPPG